MSFDLKVKYPCELKAGENLCLNIRLENNVHQQQWIGLTLVLLGDEPKTKKKTVWLNQYTAGGSVTDTDIEIPTENLPTGVHDFIIMASANARASKIAIPLKCIIN